MAMNLSRVEVKISKSEKFSKIENFQDFENYRTAGGDRIQCFPMKKVALRTTGDKVSSDWSRASCIRSG